jgi:hypothetical protein
MLAIRAFMVLRPTSPWRTFREPRSILLCGLRALGSTKTDQSDGRSVALIAPPHPKCPFQVGHLRVRAFFLLLPSTGVLASKRDFRDDVLNRSIRHLTYRYRVSRGGGSNPSSSRITDA